MIRLYVADLSNNLDITIGLEDKNFHYLVNVMRCQVGDQINLFNETEGEWKCEIFSVNKKKLQIRPLEKIVKSAIQNNIWLAFSVIKHAPLDFLLEKSTELGVAHLVPIITHRCNIKNFHMDRWKNNVLEATQQSGRLCIPKIHHPTYFDEFIKNLPDVYFFACLTTPEITKGLGITNINFIKENFSVKRKIKEGFGFIIGPEGGFSDSENSILSNHPEITPISLGNNILRAETAALKCLSLADYFLSL